MHPLHFIRPGGFASGGLLADMVQGGQGKVASILMSNLSDINGTLFAICSEIPFRGRHSRPICSDILQRLLDV